jgi:hypothetical protein
LGSLQEARHHLTKACLIRAASSPVRRTKQNFVPLIYFNVWLSDLGNDIAKEDPVEL